MAVSLLWERGREKRDITLCLQDSPNPLNGGLLIPQNLTKERQEHSGELSADRELMRVKSQLGFSKVQGLSTQVLAINLENWSNPARQVWAGPHMVMWGFLGMLRIYPSFCCPGRW